MTSELAQWLKEEQLYIKPRTRCRGCGLTVAQIIKQYGKHAVLDGRFVDPGDDYITAIEDSKAGWYCWPCIEYDEAEPRATVVLYADDIVYRFLVGEYAIFETGDDEVPGDLFEQVIRPYAKKLAWHPTDPWRGYFESSFNTVWTKVIDDWFCPQDGHNIGANDLGKFHKLYEVEKPRPDCTLLVCFPRTSNLFACGIEVYVPVWAVPIFKRWLEVETLELEDSNKT
jgi:hypothetical protein